MGQTNPNGQSAQQKIVLRAAWEELPVVKQMTADVHEQIEREGLQWDAQGLTRAFQLVQAWEVIHGALPDSGIRATG